MEKQNIISKLGGKRFILAVLFILIIAFKDFLNLDIDSIKSMVNIVLMALGVIGAEDVAKAIRQPKA
jgi:hypothetical protein